MSTPRLRRWTAAAAVGTMALLAGCTSTAPDPADQSPAPVPTTTAPSTAATPTSDPVNTSDERARDEILASYRERNRRMVEGRTDRLAELLDDDYTAIHINGYEQDKAEWLAQIDSGQMSYHAVREESAVVEVNGGTAVLTTRALVTATINGSHGTWPLESVTQYARRDGTWKPIQSRATTY